MCGAVFRERNTKLHYFFEQSDVRVSVGTSAVPATLMSVLVVRKGNIFLLSCMVIYSLQEKTAVDQPKNIN